jgi:TfoX/Sxy family transcriptional regulator of competence genes
MAYDETLAARVRAELADRSDVREQQMFGGLCFMVAGHMAVGIVGDRLMLRLGDEGAEAALGEPHVAPMDFTGRPMMTMVYVEPAGTADDAACSAWISRALAFNDSLPAKVPKQARPSGGRDG